MSVSALTTAETRRCIRNSSLVMNLIRCYHGREIGRRLRKTHPSVKSVTFREISLIGEDFHTF